MRNKFKLISIILAIIIVIFVSLSKPGQKLAYKIYFGEPVPVCIESGKMEWVGKVFVIKATHDCLAEIRKSVLSNNQNYGPIDMRFEKMKVPGVISSRDDYKKVKESGRAIYVGYRVGRKATEMFWYFSDNESVAWIHVTD